MTSLPKTPSFRLDGRNALITGGGRGIGLGAAAALAAAGAAVTVAARSLSEVEAVASAIRSQGGAASALRLDICDRDAVNAVLAQSEPFDILVNNAGTNRPKPIAEVTEADYDAVLDLNLKASFFLTQAVTTRLIAARRPGSVIFLSSQMGHVGAPSRSLYCASKWAIEGLTKALALELAPFSIRVNTLAPTFVETDLTRPFFEDNAFLAAVLTKIKLGRLGQVEDLMGALVFLASDASALMTGSALIIDGGWTAE